MTAGDLRAGWLDVRVLEGIALGWSLDEVVVSNAGDDWFAVRSACCLLSKRCDESSNCWFRDKRVWARERH